MKKKDVIRHENRFFVITEEIDNQRLGCRCINDGEIHVLWRNECVMVREYQKETKSLKTNLYEFFDFVWSDRFDVLMAKYFFVFARIAFLFCAACIPALLLSKLIGWL